MRRSFRMCLALLAAAALLLAGCSGHAGRAPGSLAEMEPIVLNVADVNSLKASNTRAVISYLERVKTETGGKIDYNIFASGSLMPGSEGLDAVGSGLVDMSYVSPTYFTEELPIFDWAQGLGAMTIGSHPQDMTAGTAAYQTVLDRSAPLKAEFAAHGAVPLAAYTSVPQTMLCTTPVETPEQAKGKRVRTAGSQFNGEIAALGMTSVYLDGTELYEGLQRGVVDCVVSSPSVFMTSGLWDVAKFYSPLQFQTATGVGYVMNAEVWNSLPPDAQKIMLDARSVFLAEALHNTATQNGTWVTKAEKRGVRFTDTTALTPVVQAEQRRRIDALVSSAPPTLTDAQQTVARFEEDFAAFGALIEQQTGLPRTDGSAASIRAAYLRTAREFPFDRYQAQLTDFLGAKS